MDMKYIDGLIEKSRKKYRDFDREFLAREMDKLSSEVEKIQDIQLSDATEEQLQFFVDEIAIHYELLDRSKDQRRSEVFTKWQARVIMLSTVVIAFFTAYPTLKSWVSNVDKVSCLFEQSVIAKERLATDAIH